jgi:CRISPR-associated protein Csd1
MILTRLYELYGRLEHDPEFDEVLPSLGTSKQKISFVVVLTPDGKLFDIQDAKIQKVLPPKTKNGKAKTIFVARDLIVPGGERKTGKGANPHLLWDKPEYMLGICPDGTKPKEKDKVKARDVLFPAFRERHRSFRDENKLHDLGLDAVVAFLESWDPTDIPDDILKKVNRYGDNFGTFAIQGKPGYVFEAPVVKDAALREMLETDPKALRGTCLITGKTNEPLVATVETKVKLAGTSVGGGAIVSFNAPSYESYGKEQTFNSPLSEEAAFKAHNALNLLISDPRYHFKLADTTVVFWTEKKTQTENLLSWIVNPPSNADGGAMDAALAQRIQSFWKVVSQAGDPDLGELGDDAATPFYMLGIEPNAARIVIRFWHESSLGDFILRLRQHAQDMAIQKAFQSEPDHIPLWVLLAQTARDAKGIPPLLAGALLRSVVEGLPYPKSLYQLTLNRVIVGHDKYKIGAKVSYCQAAVIKAFLTRNANKKGLTMGLNTENKTPAYLLGRLFAALEKTQYDASGELNANVGDKFYSSASATPRIVFPTLLDMFLKHLKKFSSVNPKFAHARKCLVRDILDDIDSTKGFPSQLTLEDRGLFALGYYQQMRAFFTKKTEAEASADNQ